MEETMINRVAESGIVTIDLEEYYPKNNIVVFDMKDYLFMGLILKEKDFREAIKQLDISQYNDKYVAITCSADAIIPMWAYMLAASTVQPVAKLVAFGNEDQVRQMVFLKNITAIPTNEFAEKRIVIKGCGDIAISEAAYVAITQHLRPVAKSIMYGEPCSTVPVFKKK
jgi:hypothetical protein